MYKQANNSSANAAATYDNSAKQVTDNQRVLEARALQKSNRQIKAVQDALKHDEKSVKPSDIHDVLTANRKLWTLFYDAALENAEGNRPDDLRSNIINLSNFIFKRTIDILAEPKPEKFDILLTINQEVSAGLLENAEKMDAQNKAKDSQNDESGVKFSGVSA